MRSHNITILVAGALPGAVLVLATGCGASDIASASVGKDTDSQIVKVVQEEGDGHEDGELAAHDAHEGEEGDLMEITLNVV